MGFFFEFVYILDYIDGIPYKLLLHPWDEAYLVMVDNHFDVFLDSVSRILLTICIDIHKANRSFILLGLFVG